MLRAFSTAATGMTAQQMIVDAIANNLANINTTGFKRTQVDFQDLVYLKLGEPGGETAEGVTAPAGMELGSGVRPAATVKIFSQGEMVNTENDLDIAIQGDGFFEVTIPNVGTRYTRDGALKMNASGNLVTSSGYTVEPAITIPANTRKINIGTDGKVTVFVGVENTPQSLGTIKLVRFPNPAGLTNEGGNLYAISPASGEATDGTAGQEGFGTVQQRFLEKSNVQMVTELVSLITAQRAYEINARAIKAGDEMLTAANRLIT